MINMPVFGVGLDGIVVKHGHCLRIAAEICVRGVLNEDVLVQLQLRTESLHVQQFF